MKLKDVHLEREKCPREKKEFKVGLKSDGNVTELIDFAPLLQSRVIGLKILVLFFLRLKAINIAFFLVHLLDTLICGYLFSQLYV